MEKEGIEAGGREAVGVGGEEEGEGEGLATAAFGNLTGTSFPPSAAAPEFSSFNSRPTLGHQSLPSSPSSFVSIYYLAQVTN